MELGPLGTQELLLAAGGLLLLILVIIILVSRGGGRDAEEPGEGDPRGVTSASRDELIERAIRAEAERDIFRATVKHLREENERLRQGHDPEEVRQDAPPIEEDDWIAPPTDEPEDG